MNGKQRMVVAVALLAAWTFLAAAAGQLVTVQRLQAEEIKANFVESNVIKGTEEVSSPKVVTQELSVDTKLTAAAIESATATIPKLNVPDTVTAKTVSAQQLNVPALLTQSVGDARNPVQAAFVGTLRATSVSTDSITLTAGGNPIATWNNGGLSLNAPLTVTGGAGSFLLDPAAGALTMKNPAGNELAKVQMSGDSVVMELHAPAGEPQDKAVVTVKKGEQPTLILGNNLYPPVVPWGIEPIEGTLDEELQVRYWVYADFEFRTQTFWRLNYKVTLENLSNTGYRFGMAMLFLDYKDLAWEQSFNLQAVELPRNGKETFSGNIEIPPELAEKTRKLKLLFSDVRRTTR